LARVGSQWHSGSHNSPSFRPRHLALTIVGDLQCDPTYAAECIALVAALPTFCVDEPRAVVAVAGGKSEHSEISAMSYTCGSDERTDSVSDVHIATNDSIIISPSICSRGRSERSRKRKKDNRRDGGCCSVSVKLEGSMPQADALAVVAASNGFLFASRFESFGLAPLEAAALGVPVCATRVGALPSRLCAASTVWVGAEGGGGASEEHEEDKGHNDMTSDSEEAAAEARCQAWVHALGTFVEALAQRDGTAATAARAYALAQRAISSSGSKSNDAGAAAASSSLQQVATRLHTVLQQRPLRPSKRDNGA
jgi:glycosyltransferase involved in cell wall biosynthesis